jgi:hypothetical protein
MKGSYNDVKMPNSQKKAIWVFTHTYVSRDIGNVFEDLVQGKGRGINFLL